MIRSSVSDTSKLWHEQLSRCNVNCVSPAMSQQQVGLIRFLSRVFFVDEVKVYTDTIAEFLLALFE